MLLTETWFLTRNPNAEDFIGKDQWFATDWLVREGLERIVEVFKGMFHQFYAFSRCLSSYNSRGGGGGTPYNGLYGGAPPERGTFFSLEVCERVGISRIQVWERVGKTAI